mgnify:CR=1 FL=1
MKKHNDTMYELRSGFDFGKMTIRQLKERGEEVPTFAYDRTLELADQIISMQDGDEHNDGVVRMTMAFTETEWRTIQQALLAANTFSMNTLRNPDAPKYAKEQAKADGLARGDLIDKIDAKRQQYFGK